MTLNELDLQMGDRAPFLISLHEEAVNNLRIIIAVAEVGKKTNDSSLLHSMDKEINSKLWQILKQCRSITPDNNHKYGVIFENYIAYQVRNESFCSFDTEEIRKGKFIITFEKSKLLEHLPKITDVQKFKDGSYYPAEWKHYGIYTQNHVIDIISHCPPQIVTLTKK